jgi:hypothetical protein
MTEIRDVYSRITGKIIADLEEGRLRKRKILHAKPRAEATAGIYRDPGPTADLLRLWACVHQLYTHAAAFRWSVSLHGRQCAVGHRNRQISKARQCKQQACHLLFGRESPGWYDPDRRESRGR